VAEDRQPGESIGGKVQQIAGIDGCQSLWLAIAHVPGSTSFVAQLLATSELPTQPWTLAAIDIPIGLPDSGAREADGAARKLIGPRASSVFPCPIRPALDATSWQEACAITYRHNGHRISKQTFAILPKIRAVDECVRSTDLRQRLFEIHPEVSFASWQGAPILYAKKDVRGQEQRRALIAGHFGPEAFASVVAQISARSVAADDIADAFAALWSAERLFAGTAQRLPSVSAIDSYGLPMHIWY
jgi:predicted RNase H-like nuclease